MNEEEKKAIEKFGRLLKGHFDEKVNKDDFLTLIEGEIILNLIEKQQKETEQLRTVLNSKDRQIDLMSEYISEQDIDDDICKKIMAITKCNYDYEQKTCTECVKQYFKNKAEEN